MPPPCGGPGQVERGWTQELDSKEAQPWGHPWPPCSLGRGQATAPPAQSPEPGDLGCWISPGLQPAQPAQDPSHGPTVSGRKGGPHMGDWCPARACERGGCVSQDGLSSPFTPWAHPLPSASQSFRPWWPNPHQHRVQQGLRVWGPSAPMIIRAWLGGPLGARVTPHMEGAAGTGTGHPLWVPVPPCPPGPECPGAASLADTWPAPNSTLVGWGGGVASLRPCLVLRLSAQRPRVRLKVGTPWSPVAKAAVPQ